MACIEHTGYRNPGGYGCVTFQQESYLAHRLAWIQANGPIPDGMVVRHRCDNRACINLAHLELGTQKENIRDALDRSRFPLGTARTQAKLSDDELCLLYTSPSPRDRQKSRMPSSA